MKLLFSIYILLSLTTVWADPAGQKGHDGSFKVSEKSLKHLGVIFQTLKGRGPWKVSKEAIVNLKLTQSVYRRYDGELMLVIVKSNSAPDGSLLISSEDLEEGDEVAIKGANFLRMAESDLNSETVDNCAH